jgi:transposase
MVTGRRRKAERSAGIDRATEAHAVCVVEADGGIRARFDVPGTGESFDGLVERPVGLGAEDVAIERPDGPLVEAMLQAGLRVSVIAPRMPKAPRQRCSATGARSDPGDASVLADVVRTDGRRLKPLVADAAAHRARSLGEARLAAFLRRIGSRGREPVGEPLARVKEAPAPGPTEAEAEGRAVRVPALLDAIEVCNRRARELEAEVVERPGLHRDAPIFTSPPKAGRGVRAASLLAAIGDARERFPDEACLAALANVAPVTRASGKSRSVGFSWACERILARAWVRVLWRMWQDRTPYDVTKHGSAEMPQTA